MIFSDWNNWKFLDREEELNFYFSIFIFHIMLELVCIISNEFIGGYVLTITQAVESWEHMYF